MMINKIFFVGVLGFLHLFFAMNSTHAAEGLPDGFVSEVFSGGFERPTAIAPLPDGRMMIAEKAGLVYIIDANGVRQETPFLDLGTTVNAAEDRGLIGLAVDPDFASNNRVYVAYTHEPDVSRPDGYFLDDTRPGCAGIDVNADWDRIDCYNIPEKNARVVRYEEVDGIATDPVVILGTEGGSAAAPSCTNYVGADCIASDSGSHSVGGLRFGPDGHLYVSTGDGAGFFFPEQQAFRSQDIDHLSGKVLRIDTDGQAVSGNPFYTDGYTADDNRSKVWAYGFRNPYRFNFTPGGNLLVADVGWGAREELNMIRQDQPGGNHGWPCREGSVDTGGYSIQAGCQDTEPFVEPIYDYEHEIVPQFGDNLVGAITGGAFATSDTYPADFRNTYVFGDAVFGFMRNIRFDGNENIQEVTDFADAVPFAVEYVTGFDGLVYYNEHYTGDIKRLVYTEAPVAVIESSALSGVSPLFVQFDGGGSSVLGNAPLTYSWDFGDGVQADGVQASHTFQEPGEYTVVLTVSSQGFTDVAETTILVEEPFVGSYDAVPVHLSTDVTSAQPYFFGNDIHVVSRFGNVGENDPFTLLFQIHGINGEHLSAYDFVVENQTIAPGSERAFDASFQLPLGEYTLHLSVISPDATVDYLWVPNIARFDVVSRSPVSEDPEIDIVASNVPQSTSDTTLYRFYSDAFQGHFYTTSEGERDGLAQNDDWRYEGIAYTFATLAATEGVPVYRFYSDAFQGHFYTISESERSLTEIDPNWRYEGIAYRVLPTSEVDSRTVYRFWSPVYRHHFFTESVAERDQIRLEDPNWTYEGIAWYLR